MPKLTLLPDNRILEAAAGDSLHCVLADLGVLEAPCGGQGKCGKCRVTVDGREVFACRTAVDRDMTVELPPASRTAPGKACGTAAAFDIGTTTLVCYLLDETGAVTAQASRDNPQRSFGADVISRIQAANAGHRESLTALIRKAMAALLAQICEEPEAVRTVALVGNPAMEQLVLGLETANLARIPFSPVLCQPETLPAGEILPICPRAKLLIVPNISGFVGGDTLGAVLATGLGTSDDLRLLVDIGTNGELVLGSRHRMMACATAAGPALEGADISCGMRAAPGAIDRVWAENGQLRYSVIGGGEAVGICGSGLIDAIAAFLDLGLLNKRGKLVHNLSPVPGEPGRIRITDRVALTQADIRSVQLAKGAIAAGIRLLAKQMEISLDQIREVLLAGAFGSHIDPESACRIGLLPQELLPRIRSVGNAAGDGSVILARDPAQLALTQTLAKQTQFLELASLPEFPKTFAKAMELPQDWVCAAKACGFSQAAEFDPAILTAREDVRAACAADKCRAYGKNWTCPPHCGSLEVCQEAMNRYRRGILVQTMGKLSKAIDSKAYRETERLHLEQFSRFCEVLRRSHPDALCLGSGGCRVCKSCAYPQPCRFPEQAVSSMEAYGLFVTQVCRDAGLSYCHGEKTITYTACVLF